MSNTIWYDVFGSVFFITIAGIVFGSFHYAFKSCYKSKCSDINIFYGCLRVKRNVNVEEHIDFIPSTQNDGESCKINV